MNWYDEFILRQYQQYQRGFSMRKRLPLILITAGIIVTILIVYLVHSGLLAKALVPTIVKFIASLIAAGIATWIASVKDKKDIGSGTPVAVRGWTTAGLAGIAALWIALSFSTTADITKYRDDKANEKITDDKYKKAQEQMAKNEINQKAIEKSSRDAAANSSLAKEGTDSANKRLTTAATQAADILEQVNTANSTLKTSTNALDGVAERQISAADTADKTLGDITQANTTLLASSKSLITLAQGQEKAAEKLDVTYDQVHSSARPLRPLRMIMHIRYDYAATGERPQTSDGFRAYSDRVRQVVDEIEKNEKNQRERREEPRLRQDMEKWWFNDQTIHLRGDCFLTNLPDLTDGWRTQHILSSGSIGLSFRPTRDAPTLLAKKTVIMFGHATFQPNQSSSPDSDYTVIPRPSNLEVTINRKTGDIEQEFYVTEVGAIGAVFGVHSLYDLPGLWMELQLPALVRVSDHPRLSYFAYQNDTFLTGGKFAESMIFKPEHFTGPINLQPTSANRMPGVLFLYPVQEEDLDSDVWFENQRRQNKFHE